MAAAFSAGGAAPAADFATWVASGNPWRPGRAGQRRRPSQGLLLQFLHALITAWHIGDRSEKCGSSRAGAAPKSCNGHIGGSQRKLCSMQKCGA